MCDCIDIIDEKLASYNTRLSKAFCIRPFGEALIIKTEVVEKKRGAKAFDVFPTFCPFCGEKIQKSPVSKNTETAA